ncbi:amino acid ABC transporter substrate-binding protein [Pseudorhodoplanes sp.]|uniref:amino acid ABC transporter substrate-binding protein n=1 Tax=Pseudorhodoplanes sp. TaxID=1934341 RepID=UPI00391C684A
MNYGFCRGFRALAASLSTAIALGFGLQAAHAADPLRIGFSISVTGPTSPAGKQVLAGLEIWRKDVNAKGGLLGRPVEFVYYDDQGSPANAPGIYAKLMSVDKVDLLIGPYSTNVIAAAMPAIIQANRTTIGIFGLGANKEFKYPRYFSMNSQGPDTGNYSKCVFDLAAQQKPKPTRVALIGADVEYSRNALDGARANAKKHGMEIVFDRTYPPSTTEFTSIVRAMAATNPDIVFGATLPIDTAGIIRTANEIQFRPKVIGGAMLGLLVTGIKQQLGPMINGYISNEFYIPAPSLQFAGTKEMMAEYQKQAKDLGLDPLGYTYPPYAYAAGQILARAVTETKSLNDDVLAKYIAANTFDTVIGPISFGPDGEWKEPRIICIQFKGISGNDMSQFTDWSRQVVVYPPEFKSGDLIFPFTDASK